MAFEIVMPALSPTMTEGTLAKWLKKEGDIIKIDDIIAEIETDKAIMELESNYNGILGKIIVPDNTQEVKVDTVIALILEQGEKLEDVIQNTYNKSCTTNTTIVAHNLNTTISDVSLESNKNTKTKINSIIGNSNHRIFASPLARCIASQNNISLNQILGTGPNGRIVKLDVLNHISHLNGTKIDIYKDNQSKTLAIDGHHVKDEIVQNSHINNSDVFHDIKINSKSNSSSYKNISNDIVKNVGFESYYIKPMTAMRNAIAKALTESKTKIPHFYLNAEFNVDKLIAIRSEINSIIKAQEVKEVKEVKGIKSIIDGAVKNTNINNSILEKSLASPNIVSPKSVSDSQHNQQQFQIKDHTKVSINDLIVKAAALALVAVPEMNVAWSDDGIIVYRCVDIAIAVAIPDGLMTPILRFVDQKSVLSISREIKSLAKKAKARQLNYDELTGGSMSISNLGMYGVDNFCAIIKPPQASIIAVGSIIQKPIIRNSEIAIGNIINITLSCDHRIIDGAIAASFLKVMRQYIEEPMLLIVS